MLIEKLCWGQGRDKRDKQSLVCGFNQFHPVPRGFILRSAMAVTHVLICGMTHSALSSRDLVGQMYPESLGRFSLRLSKKSFRIAIHFRETPFLLFWKLAGSDIILAVQHQWINPQWISRFTVPGLLSPLFFSGEIPTGAFYISMFAAYPVFGQ